MPTQQDQDHYLKDVESALAQVLAAADFENEDDRRHFRARFAKQYQKLVDRTDDYCIFEGERYTADRDEINAAFSKLERQVTNLPTAPNVAEIQKAGVQIVGAIRSMPLEPGLSTDTLEGADATDPAPAVEQDLNPPAGWTNLPDDDDLIANLATSLSNVLSKSQHINGPEKKLICEMLQTTLAQLEGPWYQREFLEFVKRTLRWALDRGLFMAVGAGIEEVQLVIDGIEQILRYKPYLPI